MKAPLNANAAAVGSLIMHSIWMPAMSAAALVACAEQRLRRCQKAVACSIAFPCEMPPNCQFAV